MKYILAGKSHAVCHCTVCFYLQNPCIETNSNAGMWAGNVKSGNDFPTDNLL
jgi:hypothetical protein